MKLVLENHLMMGNQAMLEPSFCEGLCRVLSGLNAATTRNVISATIAHLIPLYGGSCFVFSQGFSDLLVGQFEAILDGQDVNVRIRTSKHNDGQTKSWPDSLADDYIHCPEHQGFEHMSFYEEMTRVTKRCSNHYKEKAKRHINSVRHIQDMNSVISLSQNTKLYKELLYQQKLSVRWNKTNWGSTWETWNICQNGTTDVLSF